MVSGTRLYEGDVRVKVIALSRLSLDRVAVETARALDNLAGFREERG
jgi:hypothetical protein